MPQAEWPQGLTDEQAVLRLQSILIAACEGVRDLSADRDYKTFRAPLLKRLDLRDVVPTYVWSHRDLTSFWSYIRKVSDKWQSRREHIWETFRPLFDRVEGRTQAPAASSGWTGRNKRSPEQQIRVVLALAPDALEGVEMLLNEQEKTLHNGSPVDPNRQEAINRLRELHAAIGELLMLAERRRPLANQLQVVRAAKDRVIRWSRETLSLTLVEMPLVSSTAVIAGGVAYIVNAISQGAAVATTLGVGAGAAHVAGVVQKRTQAAAEKNKE